jgi:predicted nicotinamide N-methyase
MASSPAMALEMLVDVSYAAPHAHRIVNVTLHREYSPGIVFIFSQVRKDLYHA